MTNRPGDQHSSIANPFEEAKPRISEFTAIEIATLQSRLEKQLGPEYLSARSGPSGQKVHYIAAEKCIALANEVFGFNGWSSAIQNIQVDFVDENPQTLKISLGLSVIIRVTLRDGTYHEDIGYGHIENCKGKAAAFEKAKKEGTTDALKRALRNFGNVLGNCIYDKDYLAKVTKIKVGPTKFDEDSLHRHADFQKKQPVVKSDARGPTEQKPANNAAPPPRPAGMSLPPTMFFWAGFTDSFANQSRWTRWTNHLMMTLATLIWPILALRKTATRMRSYCLLRMAWETSLLRLGQQDNRIPCNRPH